MTLQADSRTTEPSVSPDVTISGSGLSVEDVIRVARGRVHVRITDDPEVIKKVLDAQRFVRDAVSRNAPIYGVTTGFGGMADVVIPPDEVRDLQQNMLWYHKVGTGGRLAEADVRASMLLRANSHLRGVSGIGMELIRRLVVFLNAGVTPHVRDLGSIGASGDLVPLTSITGALVGHPAGFTVDMEGSEIDARVALQRLGLPPLQLEAKEGLAMLNGTSVMTGIAAGCVHDATVLVALAMGTHALAIRGLGGTNQSFHPFIHAHKPHPGQRWAAAEMLELLQGPLLSRDELDGRHDHRDEDLIQDRYSLRCLPQFVGPLVDGLGNVAGQIEIEINSATDNPLIDVEGGASYHGGNFLGQYVGVGMDHLRYYLGLLTKHLDVQVAQLVTPAFSRGLPASLVGNSTRRWNMGLKGLQICANSITPQIEFLGNSLADRFPTHAEQFNQNINSQGFGSATQARRSIDLAQRYLAIALIFGVQSVDLRTHLLVGHYDARRGLSAPSAALYDAVRTVIGVVPSADRPLVWNDDEQALDIWVDRLTDDIAADGVVPAAVAGTMAGLRALRENASGR